MIRNLWGLLTGCAVLALTIPTRTESLPTNVGEGAARGGMARSTDRFVPAYHLVRKPIARVTATAIDTLRPTLDIQEWLPVATAMPELDRQQNVSTQMLIPGHAGDIAALRDRTVLQRPYLIGDIYETGRQLQVTMAYRATLMETKLVAGAPATPVADLSPEERERYTSPSSPLDFLDPDFIAWKRRNGLTKGGGETDVNYAFRVFRWIVQHAHYIRKYGEFSATKICADPNLEGACGHLASLFAATMRSENIPSRLLFGRLALPSPPEEAKAHFFPTMVHAKAEVWLQGIGWAPVEVPSALGSKSDQEMLKYFGYDPGEFLTMHIDDDLRIVLSRYGPRSLVCAQVAMVWTNPPGEWSAQTQEDWKITRVPIPEK